MSNAAMIAAGALLAGAALYLRGRSLGRATATTVDEIAWYGDTDTPPPESAPEQEQSSSIMDVLTSPMQSIAQTVDQFTGGSFHISKMSQVTPDMLQHAQIQAILRVIRRGEGTSDQDGYRRHFGGVLFDSFADHPRTKYTAGGYTSSAAGAYQFLASTWDETAAILGLDDFSPPSQDLAALARIVYRGALDDVLAGDLTAAMPKLGKEWASLPGSPYGQPTISMQTVQTAFTSAGGMLA